MLKLARDFLLLVLTNIFKKEQKIDLKVSKRSSVANNILLQKKKKKLFTYISRGFSPANYKRYKKEK